MDIALSQRHRVSFVGVLSVAMCLDICDNTGMSKPEGDFRAALDNTLKHLADALGRRETLQLQLAEIDGRIDDLGEAAISIGRLCGIDPQTTYPELFPQHADPEIGFTDAVRQVFDNAPEQWYEPVSVRDELARLKFPLERYKNPLASIHTILRRLHEQGELKRMELEDMVRYCSLKAGKKRRRRK